MIAAACLAFIIIAAVVFLPAPRDMQKFTVSIAALMPKEQLKHLSGFVETCLILEDDGKFWHVSHGIPGMFTRFLRSLLFLALIRGLCKAGQIPLMDCLRIVKVAAFQLIFSIFGVPEALLCIILPGWPHVSSRTALSFHSALLRESCTLCSEVSERTSIPVIEFLL